MSRPQRFGQEHDGEDAYRIVAADARRCEVRRSQYSRQSRGISQAPGLRSRGAQFVSVLDWLGIFGVDWNAARDVAPRSRKENRFPAATLLPASAPARQHWLLFEGNAAAHSADRRDHGRS